jgi:hypothetical protein
VILPTLSQSVESQGPTQAVDSDAITVLVTFVGGPADGRTEGLPLHRMHEPITLSGVQYRLTTDVVETSEGLAQAFRPV